MISEMECHITYTGLQWFIIYENCMSHHIYRSPMVSEMECHITYTGLQWFIIYENCLSHHIYRSPMVYEYCMSTTYTGLQWFLKWSVTTHTQATNDLWKLYVTPHIQVSNDLWILYVNHIYRSPMVYCMCIVKREVFKRYFPKQL